MESTQVLPKAILFDLDDTLISAYNQPHRAWQMIAEEFAADCTLARRPVAAAAINHAADMFWAIRNGTASAGCNWSTRAPRSSPMLSPHRRSWASPPGGRHRSHGRPLQSLREEQMYLFDGAHHVVDTFRAKGVRLALITNGAAARNVRKSCVST